jgi:hypothetical protein
MQMGLLSAREASAGLVTDLTEAIDDAEAALAGIVRKQERKSIAPIASADGGEEGGDGAPAKSKTIAAWDSEVEELCEERERERREKASALQGQVAGDDDFAILSLKVSCDADPEVGLRAQLNEMNTVVAVLQAGGGMADAEGLHVGDVVLTLNGASLGGERLAKAIKTLPQSPTYELTVARQRNLGVILNEDGLPRGDFSGRAHRGNAWTGLRLGSSPECSCPTSFARLAGGCSWAELGTASWSATARPPASAARARPSAGA